MSSPQLSRMVVNSLKAILGEEFTVHSFTKLPSRRNEVYKITGSLPSQSTPSEFVAKLYKEPGIAHETTILQKAHEHNLHVPLIIGTTADVLVLEFIDAPNLCDLITLNPDPILGQLLGSWLAQFHSVFSRGEDQVLVKGDARIRNFLVQKDHLVGVDFEDSHVGSYLEDLSIACASILDTTPIFTKAKLRLCTLLINHYGELRQIPKSQQLLSQTQIQMISDLQETAKRRGNPQTLLSKINQFKKHGFSL